MRIFQDTFETRKQLFMIAFSICMKNLTILQHGVGKRLVKFMGKHKLVIFITVQTTTVNFQIQKINRSSRGRCYVKRGYLKN